MRVTSRWPRAWPWWCLGALAVAVGIFLRAGQLRGQMLIDDEWHALRKLLESDFVGIATHFGYADYCIPLTLYYRWLFEHGALSEWQMHLPLLLAGIAGLVAAPGLLHRELPAPVRAIWIGLLAISPSLIYFSRTARPYALIALLGPIAIIAFHAWQRDRSSWRCWLPLYVFTTCAAGWLHLLSLVFTLWPFAFYGIAALWDCRLAAQRPRALQKLGELICLGVGVVSVLALALAPPLLHDWTSMKAKANAASVTVESIYRTVLMQLGIADAWACAALVALWAYGVFRLWQRERQFTALVLGACLVGGATICLARPAWIQHAPVLVRYAAPVLPLLLLFIAEGLAGLAERLEARWLGAMLAAASLVGLVACGPLPSWFYRPNQFMGHAVFQFDYAPSANPYTTLLELGPIPEFYRALAQRPPGSVTLIEAPRRAESNYMPDPWHQAVHRQNVKYALVGSVCGAGDWDIIASTRGAALHRLVELGEVLDGAAHGGDYLVLNLAPWTLPPGAAFPRKITWPDMGACVDKVTARLGSPVFRDERIVVFALSDRARAQSEPSPLPPSMMRAPR